MMKWKARLNKKLFKLERETLFRKPRIGDSLYILDKINLFQKL